MLHDRILVSLEGEPGERKSGGGILIPATASIGKRLVWAHVVATGPHVRQVCVDDRVLFDPEDRAEVELQSKDYLLLRNGTSMPSRPPTSVTTSRPGSTSRAQPTGIPASRHAANPPSIAGRSNVSPSAPTRAMRRR